MQASRRARRPLHVGCAKGIRPRFIGFYVSEIGYTFQAEALVLWRRNMVGSRHACTVIDGARALCHTCSRRRHIDDGHILQLPCAWLMCVTVIGGSVRRRPAARTHRRRDEKRENELRTPPSVKRALVIPAERARPSRPNPPSPSFYACTYYAGKISCIRVHVLNDYIHTLVGLAHIELFMGSQARSVCVGKKKRAKNDSSQEDCGVAGANMSASSLS